jgi:hypothetical protein
MTSSKRIVVLVALLTIVFGGVTMAYASSRDTIQAAEASPEIEGTWLATITVPDGPPPFPSIVTYARGGGFVATDSSVSPALGNVYHGAWTKTGPHQFAFTFLGFQYDASGVLAGYVRAHETLQLEPGGDVYNGVTSIEILDINQDVIMRLSSTSHATRLNAQ